MFGLGHWRSDLDAAMHSVLTAHGQTARPAEWRAVDGVISIQ
jgi:uncharacterized protein Usg